MLHMLRNEVGTEHFWAGIREYFRRFRDSNVLTEDLQVVMEEVSGQDLSHFFEQWVYRPGQPDLVAKWTYDADAGQVRIQIEQGQDESFDFPLEIGIADVGGGLTIERVHVSDAGHSFTIDVDKAPHAIELDPNTNLLFSSERANLDRRE